MANQSLILHYSLGHGPINRVKMAPKPHSKPRKRPKSGTIVPVEAFDEGLASGFERPKDMANFPGYCVASF